MFDLWQKYLYLMNNQNYDTKKVIPVSTGIVFTFIRICVLHFIKLILVQFIIMTSTAY